MQRTGVLMGLCLGAAAAAVMAQEAAKTHIALAPPELKWAPAPPAFPKGATMAVLAGDPGASGPFAVRARMPAGYKVAPHFHPTDENITVLSGVFALGMGDKFEEATMKALPVGGYASMPAGMHHFAMARTPVVIQIHGVGPFALTYVNPADDPRQQAPATK